MGNLIIIPDENAFTLRLTGQIRTGDYTEDADFSVVTNLGVHFIRRGRIAQEFVLDEQGRIVIENEGNLARGVYGVELYGYYHGEKWRAFAKNVFAIVNNTEELLPVYDATIDVSFGGDGVSAAYVEATLAAHNADQESHPDLREALDGMVSDVKVGDTSIVENGVATINPDSLGKVDDVQVNGVSVLTGKEAEITMPTKVSDLTNDAHYQTADEVQQAIEVNLVPNAQVTVDNNVGTPAATVTKDGNTLQFAFQNMKGETGATGATGPQGPKGNPGDSVLVGEGDLPLAHVLGQDNTKAMSQKGVTDAIENVHLDVVNNLTDGGAAKVLSAEMGKELKRLIDRTRSISEFFILTEEDGVFIVDEGMNIGLKFTTDGLLTKGLISYEILN